MIKKPTKKGVTDVATFAASATAGMMLSKGVEGMLPQSKFVRPGLAIVALVLAASIGGKGLGADVAKGIATGASLAYVKDLATEAIQPLVPTYDDPNAFQKFIGDSTGMNGFDDAQQIYFAPFTEGLRGNNDFSDQQEYIVENPLM